MQDSLLERRERRLERGQPPDFEARRWARGLEPKAGGAAGVLRHPCLSIVGSQPPPAPGWEVVPCLAPARRGRAGVVTTCALPLLGVLGVRLFQRARSRVLMGESMRALQFSVREGFVRLRGFGGSCALTTLVQPGHFALRLIIQLARGVISSAVCLVSVWGDCSMFREEAHLFPRWKKQIHVCFLEFV